MWCLVALSIYSVISSFFLSHSMCGITNLALKHFPAHARSNQPKYPHLLVEYQNINISSRPSVCVICLLLDTHPILHAQSDAWAPVYCPWYHGAIKVTWTSRNSGWFCAYRFSSYRSCFTMLSFKHIELSRLYAMGAWHKLKNGTCCHSHLVLCMPYFVFMRKPQSWLTRDVHESRYLWSLFPLT